jgi:hypothetical protein
LALTSLTNGGRSVGIARQRTEATKFFNRHNLLNTDFWKIGISHSLRFPRL